MKKLLLALMFTSSANALVEFKTGDVVTAADINGNFQELEAGNVQTSEDLTAAKEELTEDVLSLESKDDAIGVELDALQAVDVVTIRSVLENSVFASSLDVRIAELQPQIGEALSAVIGLNNADNALTGAINATKEELLADMLAVNVSLDKTKAADETRHYENKDAISVNTEGIRDITYDLSSISNLPDKLDEHKAYIEGVLFQMDYVVTKNGAGMRENTDRSTLNQDMATTATSEIYHLKEEAALRDDQVSAVQTAVEELTGVSVGVSNAELQGVPVYVAANGIRHYDVYFTPSRYVTINSEGEFTFTTYTYYQDGYCAGTAYERLGAADLYNINGYMVPSKSSYAWDSRKLYERDFSKLVSMEAGSYWSKGECTQTDVSNGIYLELIEVDTLDTTIPLRLDWIVNTTITRIDRI